MASNECKDQGCLTRFCDEHELYWLLTSCQAMWGLLITHTVSTTVCIIHSIQYRLESITYYKQNFELFQCLDEVEEN